MFDHKRLEVVKQYLPEGIANSSLWVAFAIIYLRGLKDGLTDYSEQRWTDSDVRDLMELYEEAEVPFTSSPFRKE